ncbi:MAG TPA: GGDEF domain-containing protein, partial [Bacillota bacterium]|nr:GGDEF domain-containing protein [Bacillota bacterium]
VNLIVFPGKSLKITYNNDYNYNVIYELVNGNNIDGLVIATTVLRGFISQDQFMAFYSRFQSLPVVSIGIPIDGVPSVLINNRTGFKQLLNHLIHDHHKRKIAFIKGPDKHIDAQERFLAYREVLEENGIEFDPDLVAPGDFTHHLAPQAMKLLDERKAVYDAIAASNDLMAIEVLRILRERNIRVPEQMAVTGFDNGVKAKYMNPSLTTVKQPIYEQSQKALEMVLELIQGKQPGNVVLDTEMVIRESCGCLSETLQPFYTDPAHCQIKPAPWGGPKLDLIIESFFDQNLGFIYSQMVKFRSLKSFITSCFQLFAGDELEAFEVEELFHSFTSMIDVPDLDANDILAIQKIITLLKKWIETSLGNARTPAVASTPAVAGEYAQAEYSPREYSRNRLLEKVFFQKLRVFVTDMALKMKGSRLSSYHSEIYRLRGVLIEVNSKIHNYHEQLHSIIPNLRALHINYCYVYLYDKPIRHRRSDVWQNPPMVNLVMAYQAENWILEENQRLPWEEVINNRFLPGNNRYTLMVNPLFVEEEHIGMILMELDMRNNYLAEPLIIEVSCALRLSLLLYEREQIDNRLREAVKELEEYNRKLKRVSQTDELTGLYNRRGFLDLAKQSLFQARKQGKGGLVFYGDMDGLKQINDQYSHEEGDAAIRAMAKILIKTFWASDIIARIGGDEFTIFTVGTDIELLPKIKERLRKHTEEYNLQAGKAYRISITIGAIPFHSGTNLGAPVTLENLLSQADKMLYEEKKRKKGM